MLLNIDEGGREGEREGESLFPAEKGGRRVKDDLLTCQQETWHYKLHSQEIYIQQVLLIRLFCSVCVCVCGVCVYTDEDGPDRLKKI